MCLWPVAAPANVFPDAEAQSRWQKRIQEERLRKNRCLQRKDDGRKDSLWQVWRAELPDRKQTDRPLCLRLKLWASLLDPDFKHSLHVSQLSLQLYDGLAAQRKVPGLRTPEDREPSWDGRVVHDVGRSKDEKGHHKTSYRMIRDLTPPLGLRSQDLLTAGIVARYHRGALPGAGQKTLLGLSLPAKEIVSDWRPFFAWPTPLTPRAMGGSGRLKVERPKNGLLLIAAQGYSRATTRPKPSPPPAICWKLSIAARSWSSR